MKPTRRGHALIVLVLAGGLVGFAFGARALNAVIVSGGVGLVAGAVQLARAGEPELERRAPEPGHEGDSTTVEIDIESPVPCRVVDRVGEGLTALEEPVVETSGDGQLAYTVALERRGERRLGRATVVTTDSFGLFAREDVHPVETTVDVYPAVFGITGTLGTEQLGERPERGAFDRVREYQPGDPLRNVHWTSSAKSPDGLVVAEYTADQDDLVRLAAVSTGGTAAADRMATATASVALMFLDAGVPVALAISDGILPAQTGREHRRELLRLLTRTTGGELPAQTKRSADVLVQATERSVEIHDGRRSHTFQDLTVEASG